MHFYAPLSNWRDVHVADNHAGPKWTEAEAVRRLLEVHYPDAEKITLVMENFSTHASSLRYRAFELAHARALLDKLEFVFTPNCGSSLNMAECEFSVLSRQCLDRRILDIDTLRGEIQA